MEHIYYIPFSEERRELRKMWNTLNTPDHPIDWDDYLNQAEAEIDLFEHYDSLPIEVRVILDKYSEMDYTYETCSNLVDDLNEVGFSCSYGLDAEPFGLHKL